MATDSAKQTDDSDSGWSTAPILGAVPTTSASGLTNPFTFPSPAAPSVSLSIPLASATDDDDANNAAKRRKGAINPNGANVHIRFELVYDF